MTATALQGVAAALATLHAEAIRLNRESWKVFGDGWRDGMAGPAHTAATIAALRVQTRLMEAMSWLLTAQAVAAGDTRDPGPPTWRAGVVDETVLSGDRAGLAAAVGELYRRVVALDAGMRA